MKKIIFIFIFIISTASMFAANFPDPIKGKMLSDYASIFNPTQAKNLESKLRVFNDTTSTQIAILTVNELDGYTASDFAIQTAEKWGIGGKKKDNGILILVKPKTDTKGEVFIAVGYGLEGAIPDAISKRIVEQIMIPAFRQNDYYSGISNATDALMKLSSGEFTTDSIPDNNESGSVSTIVIMVIIILLLVAVSGKGGKDSVTYGDSDHNRRSASAGIPPIFFGGSSRGGGFGGSGGGFGGFGGGSFGGGGAGGSW